MNRVSEDTYAFSRVPKEARVNLINVTLVRIGMATALSQFMLGAILGHGMRFWDAMLATLLGSLLLEFVSLALGVAGMKEGLSISLLARWAGFGRVGSALIGLIIVTSLLGWFGIQNSVLAEGLLYALDYNINFRWIAAFSGILLTIYVAFGFRALTWIAKISVPLFCLVIGWIIYLLFRDHNYFNLMHSSPSGTPLTLGEGTTIISGVIIIGALITPDISRYCKNNSHVFWMITSSVIIGEFIINAVSILIAHALGTADIVTIMTHSAGWIGILSVILSAVKVNDINLYSSSLGLSNAIEAISKKKLNYFWITLFLGTLGTLLSVFGILDHFVNFLSILGVIFPPIAGVMLVDYYILQTSRDILNKTRAQGSLPSDSSIPFISWPAIIASALGTAIGVLIKWGIPSLNSIIVAGFCYWLLIVIQRKHQKK